MLAYALATADVDLLRVCTLSQKNLRKGPMHPSLPAFKAPREHRCCWGSVCPFSLGGSSDLMTQLMKCSNWEALSPCPERAEESLLAHLAAVQIAAPAQPEEGCDG